MNIAASAHINSDRSRAWRMVSRFLDALCLWEDRHCQWEWLRWRYRENRKHRFKV